MLIAFAMKIGVGSKNKTKVDAVVAAIADYSMFTTAVVIGVPVEVEEFGHPKNIEETVSGAVSRAKQAWEGNDYGFGIEGGLIEVPYSKTGYMEVAVCAIYDGKGLHLGISPACEWPIRVTDLILNEGLDGSQAMKTAGMTSEQKLGENKGFIDIVTNGRMDRTTFNKLAITMALVHLEHPEYY